MIPHPSTYVASAEEHRQELLAFAARERLAPPIPAQLSRAPVLPPLLGLVSHVVQMLRRSLSVQPRPRVWTHA